MATRRRSGSGSVGLSKWNLYSGGTSAAAGKHSYDLYASNGRQYWISPHTTQRGRHAGYWLSVFPGGIAKERGHTGIDASGAEVMVNSSASNFRSPQAAANAAAMHMRSR